MELLTDGGVDVLQTLGRNRDLTTTEDVPIFYAGTSVNPWVDECETLSLRITNNLVALAQVVIDVYYALGA